MNTSISIMPRKKRAESLRRELSNLKAELRKAKGGFKRAIIQDEIRSVCRELARLED